MVLYLGRNWTRAELLQHVGHIEQIAGINALEVVDGLGRGIRRFHVYNGTGLSYWVLADRALDISACYFRGLPLTWTSSSGEVHPAYYEAEGLGWLRSFPGGLLVTCGLDQFGAPAVDAGEAFGIHGRVSNLPAAQVNYRTFWADGEYQLEISGQVRQACLFGENLLLQRRITSRLGANRITVEDVVTNEGFVAQPHLILYHCNFGFPLVGPQTQLELDAEETIARDADAEKGLQSWHQCQPPTPNYREQVFRHHPVVGSRGEVIVGLNNPELDFKVRIEYDATHLPYLFQWKMMGLGAYVMGIEPANSGVIEGRAVARQRGDLPYLEPGESRTYRLMFEVVTHN
jgi:hypothetical protein